MCNIVTFIHQWVWAMIRGNDVLRLKMFTENGPDVFKRGKYFHVKRTKAAFK